MYRLIHETFSKMDFSIVTLMSWQRSAAFENGQSAVILSTFYLFKLPLYKSLFCFAYYDKYHKGFFKYGLEITSQIRKHQKKSTCMKLIEQISGNIQSISLLIFL